MAIEASESKSEYGARRIRESSRDQILSVFTRLVAEQGYDAATISEVAETVGVSKGTVVHHFSNKFRMLELSHESYLKSRRDQTLQVLKIAKNAPQRLAAIIYCLVRAHHSTPYETTAFLREFTRFQLHASEPLRKLREEYAGVLTRVLEEGVANGEFSDIDIRLTALQVFGMCNYAWTWYRIDGPSSPEEIAAVFSNNMLTGMVAPDVEDKQFGISVAWFVGISDEIDREDKLR